MKKFFALRGGKTARLVTFGLLSGLVNGLLGAGGGILIVFGLAPLIARNSEDRRDVFANALCVMLPVSAVSAIRYCLGGMLDVEYIPEIILPAIIGGIVGGILLDKLKENVIMKLFAFLVIYSGLAMIVR
jgi:uncharacterized membrane protein YfcA